jgi:hypothetical protein
MRLNRKGFMLAEVTIVSAIAVTVMVLLYSSSSKMIEAYKTRENYYNVDTIYATGYIYNYLIDSLMVNDYIGSYSTYKNITTGDEYINKIVLEYDLKQVFFVKGNNIDNLLSLDINRTMKNYLNNYVKINADDDKYYLIVERKADNNYYYYYAEM